MEAPGLLKSLKLKSWSPGVRLVLLDTGTCNTCRTKQRYLMKIQHHFLSKELLERRALPPVGSFATLKLKYEMRACGPEKEQHENPKAENVLIRLSTNSSKHLATQTPTTKHLGTPVTII